MAYRPRHEIAAIETDRSGMSGRGYAMGVAVGDFNNDGYPDVFITRLGRNSLYRNNGDGTFTDITQESGLATDKPRWSSSAAWCARLPRAARSNC